MHHRKSFVILSRSGCDFVDILTLDGDLYAGTSVDFMGTNAAIFRTSVHSSNQHYIRTEAYQDHWLNGEK